MIVGLLLGAALAQPVCPDLQPPDRERLSVAWVSHMGKKVGRKAALTVVPTTELRQWATLESANVGRVLQGLGLRRTADLPQSAWMVTVFDVRADALCRPMALQEPGSVVQGLPVCPRGDRGVPGRYDGDGCALDLADATPGPQLFQITWEVAAAQGFCVLPLSRFLEGR